MNLTQGLQSSLLALHPVSAKEVLRLSAAQKEQEVTCPIFPLCLVVERPVKASEKNGITLLTWGSAKIINKTICTLVPSSGKVFLNRYVCKKNIDSYPEILKLVLFP